MTTAAGIIECKKHAMRQNQEGDWIVSFAIHPSDPLPDWLIKAKPGQRTAITVALLNESGADTADSKQPAAPGAVHSPAKSAGPTYPTPIGASASLPPAVPEDRQKPPAEGDAPEAPPTQLDADGFIRPQRMKPRTPVHERPLSQQAGILCNDKAFWKWAHGGHTSWSKTWSEKQCEIWLKEQVDIRSFTQLDDMVNTDKRDRFIELVERFERETGRTTRRD